MLVVVLNAGQCELVLERALVLDDEVDLFTFFGIETVGDEPRRSVAVAHDDGHGARRLLRIAGLTRREMFTLMGDRREHCCAQKNRNGCSIQTRSFHVHAPCQCCPLWPFMRGFTTVTSISSRAGAAVSIDPRQLGDLLGGRKWHHCPDRLGLATAPALTWLWLLAPRRGGSFCLTEGERGRATKRTTRLCLSLSAFR